MGFGRKGRNPTGNEMPNVSEGQTLRPSHINQIVAAADRATLKGGKGYKFTQTSGGTSLKIDQPNNPAPWSVFTYGDNLCINTGNVWGKGIGQMPLHTTSEWAGLPPDFTKKFYTARPVMVGVSGANIVSTDEVNSERSEQTGVITMPLLTGYYYIEYGMWDGREDNFSNGVGDDLEGTNQFILKHSASLSAASEVVVICYVDANQVAYQAVKGDIWWGLSTGDDYPFKISVRQDANQQWRVFVSYGTVNNIVPIYELGETVGDPNFEGVTGIGGGDDLPAMEYGVVLELAYVEDEPFPSLSTPPVVKLRGEWQRQNNPDTDDVAYILLGRINVETEGTGENTVPKFTISNAVSGSLWCERFKCGEQSAIYWVTKV